MNIKLSFYYENLMNNPLLKLLGRLLKGNSQVSKEVKALRDELEELKKKMKDDEE